MQPWQVDLALSTSNVDCYIPACMGFWYPPANSNISYSWHSRASQIILLFAHSNDNVGSACYDRYGLLNFAMGNFPLEASLCRPCTIIIRGTGPLGHGLLFLWLCHPSLQYRYIPFCH